MRASFRKIALLGSVFFVAAGWYFTIVQAAPFIYRVLPNTEDDANLEYIEIANNTCEILSLSGYFLEDASGKQFLFHEEFLWSGSIRRVLRPESKITLNNENEIVRIFTPGNILASEIQYISSQKGVAIVFSGAIPDCINSVFTGSETETWETDIWTWDEEPIGIEETGGMVGTWVQNVLEWEWSGEITDSWSQDIFGSWNVYSSGSEVLINTGATGSLSEVSTGVLNTENSWGISTTTSQSLPTSGGGWISSGVNVVTVRPNIVPVRLVLEDTDQNEKIDRVTVEYSGMLSGTLHPEGIRIYSNTWWLGSQRIDMGTGIISDMRISGSLLTLDLLEQDLEHTNLHVSAWTESDFRIKTYASFGLIGIFGETVEALTYTKSFSGYSKIYIENRAYSPPIESGIVLTWTTEFLSGTTSSKEIFETSRLTASGTQIISPISTKAPKKKTASKKKTKTLSGSILAKIENVWVDKKNSKSSVKKSAKTTSKKKANTKNSPKTEKTNKTSGASFIPIASAAWKDENAASELPMDFVFWWLVSLLSSGIGYICARKFSLP